MHNPTRHQLDLSVPALLQTLVVSKMPQEVPQCRTPIYNLSKWSGTERRRFQSGVDAERNEIVVENSLIRAYVK